MYRMDLKTQQGRRESGTICESSIDIYTLPCVKQLVGNCYMTQGAQPGLCDDLKGWGEQEGDSRGEDIYIVTTDSVCCMAESHKTL